MFFFDAVFLSLADNLPCRVIGDPLQSIFELGNRPVVNWHNDVQPHFNQLLGPAEPHRWLKTNPDLGSWLLRVRPQLDQSLPIDLAGSPVNWLEALREVPGVIVYRRELLDEMQRACRALAEQEAGTLADAAWIVRYGTRQRGRRFARCAMGTTLRVKGLEFDHAIVLDPSKYDARNPCVALTRGSKSVTVVSATATVTPKPTVQHAARKDRS